MIWNFFFQELDHMRDWEKENSWNELQVDVDREASRNLTTFQ